MQTLTAKLLNENLKKGWTEEDFASYLGISETQFFQLLRKNFNTKFSESVTKQLKKNRKKHKKVEKNDNIQKSEATEITTKTEELTPTNEVTNNISTQSDEEITENTITSDNSDKVSNNLEELLNQESILQKQICDCENILISLYGKRKGLNSKLEEIQDKIKELIVLANSYSETVSNISSELDILSDTIEHQNSDIRKKRENLESIRIQIQTLTKITILAYSDGSLDFENADTISIPDEWENLYEILMKDDKFEALTAKQIKLLAKLITLTQHLEKINKEFEIVFESQELENYFLNLSK